MGGTTIGAFGLDSTRCSRAPTLGAADTLTPSFVAVGVREGADALALAEPPVRTVRWGRGVACLAGAELELDA